MCYYARAAIASSIIKTSSSSYATIPDVICAALCDSGNSPLCSKTSHAQSYSPILLTAMFAPWQLLMLLLLLLLAQPLQDSTHALNMHVSGAGTFPAELTLVLLYRLLVDSNSLSGPLPVWPENTGLAVLGLSNNTFTGQQLHSLACA